MRLSSVPVEPVAGTPMAGVAVGWLTGSAAGTRGGRISPCTARTTGRTKGNAEEIIRTKRRVAILKRNCRRACGLSAFRRSRQGGADTAANEPRRNQVTAK